MKGADLIRIDGSVVVGIQPPSAHMLDTPIEQQYSDWGNIASEIASDAFQPAPETLPTEDPKERVVSQDTPVSVSLAELLAEVDAILYPKPRVNTSPEICGHHYVELPKRKETNWESPAVVAWQAYQQRKSDELMAYRQRRNGGAAC